MRSDLSARNAETTDTTAMVIEIVFALFGTMGMGWIYAGNLATGIGLFAGWLIVVLVGVLSPALISALTLAESPFTYCCLLVLPPITIVAAIVSGLRVKVYVRNTGATGSIGNLIIAAVIAIVLVCLAVAIPIYALGGLCGAWMWC